MNTPTAQVLEDEPKIRQFVRSSLEAQVFLDLTAVPAVEIDFDRAVDAVVDPSVQQ
ncbi:hypothetical protein [Rhizobacter sp. P5_C2]